MSLLPFLKTWAQKNNEKKKEQHHVNSVLVNYGHDFYWRSVHQYANILLLYNITFFPINLIAVHVYEETNTR